jgi:hemerythrin-like domain-containing protein
MLAAIARVLEGDTWQQPGPQMSLLRRLIQDFRDFEARTHRPKGVVLLDSMRGRSSQADKLLDALEQESRQCDQLLVQALEALEMNAHAEGADGSSVVSLLLRHRGLMMQQLDQEHTVLRSYTTQLLTSEEWSAVVSSISSVVRSAKVRRMPTPH